MATRKRIKRHIGFHPECKNYIPKCKDTNLSDVINIYDDELEALRLMDFLGLYQEDAAKKMNISRPTLSRIIDRARKKVTDFILHGKSLEIDESSKKTFKIAIPTDDGKTIANHHVLCQKIMIIDVEDSEIIDKKIIKNPVMSYIEENKIDLTNHSDGMGLGAGRLIPPVIKDVNIFIAYKLGDGLKRNLEGMGITTISTTQNDPLEAINQLI